MSLCGGEAMPAMHAEVVGGAAHRRSKRDHDQHEFMCTGCSQMLPRVRHGVLCESVSPREIGRLLPLWKCGSAGCPTDSLSGDMALAVDGCAIDRETRRDVASLFTCASDDWSVKTCARKNVMNRAH